jgi:malonate-semialdehyde dehydrogenase (acetylating) / methylmalonate-semialdehyde dehydrogenase
VTATAARERVIQNYVGGGWVDAGAQETLEVTNPATGETLARVPLSSHSDLDAAVAAARRALPIWREVSVPDRARWLFELREGLSSRREELARSVTTEMGKTLLDARAEVARMIEMVECACAVPTTMQGRGLENVSRNVDCETIRQPVGVCAAIVPFNFPAMVPFWFLPFAIACGNTFILKPSEQVPLTQQIAFEVLDGLGLPPGTVTWSTERARWSRAFSITPGSTPSRSSARRRWRGSSTSARRRRASACRRSGGPRTTWWSCPMPCSSPR